MSLGVYNYCDAFYLEKKNEMMKKITNKLLFHTHFQTAFITIMNWVHKNQCRKKGKSTWLLPPKMIEKKRTQPCISV